MLQLLNPIAKPIAEILAAFYSVFPNYGVDILVLSVVWMAIISPLTLKSTRSMLAMQALQPELKRLQEKHRHDRQAFAQAQMDLFKERGVSPFGSCLPMLLPMPVFFALFEVIDGLSRLVRVHGHLQPQPRYLNPSTELYKSIVAAHGHLNAFGLDLSKNALSAHTSFAAAIPYFVLLLAMIATQYYQTAMTMSRNPAAQQNPQMKMMKFLPIVFGVICIRFPAGVVLYYAMSNLCRIAQQWGMYRFDPKVKALVSTEVDEVEAKTRDIDRAASPRRSQPDPGAAPPVGRPRFRELLANAAGGGQGTGQANRPPAGRAPKSSGPVPNGGAAKPSGAGGAADRQPGRRDARTPPPGSKRPDGAQPAKAPPTNGAGKPATNGSSAAPNRSRQVTPRPATDGGGRDGRGKDGAGRSPDRPAAGAGAARAGTPGGRNIPAARRRSKKRRGR
jgi:YidC/Oxa1 family membrane protein insertase